jgi:hypothetical protein
MSESSDEEPTLAQLYGSQRAAEVAADQKSDDSAMPDWMETHVSASTSQFYCASTVVCSSMVQLGCLLCFPHFAFGLCIILCICGEVFVLSATAFTSSDDT